VTTMMLTEAQADGRACVSCGGDREAMVPVGRLTETGVQVFACIGGCALLFQITNAVPS
jgi:hypothetical protein